VHPTLEITDVEVSRGLSRGSAWGLVEHVKFGFGPDSNDTCLFLAILSSQRETKGATTADMD
jgi:hypothetical protein